MASPSTNVGDMVNQDSAPTGRGAMESKSVQAMVMRPANCYPADSAPEGRCPPNAAPQGKSACRRGEFTSLRETRELQFEGLLKPNSLDSPGYYAPLGRRSTSGDGIPSSARPSVVSLWYSMAAEVRLMDIHNDTIPPAVHLPRVGVGNPGRIPPEAIDARPPKQEGPGVPWSSNSDAFHPRNVGKAAECHACGQTFTYPFFNAISWELPRLILHAPLFESPIDTRRR
jgi:hypothetical protein